jgi:2-amino-4-hydroxy-6-hydroxymethyldihydropteridine diphosphokinase
MNKVFILSGSNLGNREGNMSKALELIIQRVGKLIRKSELYLTQPWGFRSGNNFLNQAIYIETDLSPRLLLSELKEIEKEMGRVKSCNGYESRIIDLDILFYNDQIIEEGDELVVPHPKIQERRFVLVPMNEIALDFIHPKLHKSINRLTDLCKDNSSVSLHQV